MTPLAVELERALSLARRQRHADQLLVVPSVDALVGEGWVAPDHVPAKGDAGRFQQLAAADLVVPLGTESGDEEMARLAHQEEAIAMLDDR